MYRTAAVLLNLLLFTVVHGVDKCPGVPETAMGFGQQGLMLSNRGDMHGALACFEESRRVDPTQVTTLANLAILYDRLGRIQSACDAYGDAVKHSPPSHRVQLLGFQGSCLTRLNEHDRAVSVFKTMMTEVKPGSGLPKRVDRFNYGVSLSSIGKYQEAAKQYEAVLAEAPDDASSLVNLASILRAEPGREHDALTKLLHAVKVQPDMAEGWYNLGTVQEMPSIGQLDEAMASYTRAIEQKPNFGAAHLARGHLFKNKGELRKALADFKLAAKILPKEPRAHTAVAIVLQEIGGAKGPAEAETIYRRMMKEHPDYPYSYLNLAQMIRHSGVEGSQQQALDLLARAAELSPTTAEVWGAQGDVLLDKRDYTAAMSSLAKADTLDGDGNVYFCHLLVAKYITCSWDDLENDHARMHAIVKEQISTSPEHGVECVHPFISVTYPLSLDDQLALSHKHALIARTRVKDIPKFTSYPQLPSMAVTPRPRLRIGYASSEIRNHPLAMLLEKQLIGHNRDRFEVFVYALTPDNLELIKRTASAQRMRAKIEKNAEHFRDVSRMTVPQIAQQIHDDGIQILFNLDGYTSTNERPQLYELKPAPVQISYMGFAATMGTENVPYILTDRHATPPFLSDKYGEQFLYMPYSYYLNNHRYRWTDVTSQLPSEQLKRSAWGLPEDKFIFANFGRNQKYSPSLFDSWARILERVPNSVLWMLRYPPAAENNIRREFVARGTPSDRLVFTDKMAMEYHLARSALADLVLDTSVYNGHTTIVDCLWVGVPMVTHRGPATMVSKVAASLAYALEMPEMVTETMEDYEDLAVHWATHRDELASVRARLQRKKHSAPLFDGDQWIQDLEYGLEQVWEVHELGLPQPPHIIFSPANRETPTRSPSSEGIKHPHDTDDTAHRLAADLPLAADEPLHPHHHVTDEHVLHPHVEREYGHDDRNDNVPRDKGDEDDAWDLPPMPAGQGVS